jgi:hypothetical protein
MKLLSTHQGMPKWWHESPSTATFENLRSHIVTPSHPLVTFILPPPPATIPSNQLLNPPNPKTSHSHPPFLTPKPSQQPTNPPPQHP